MACLAGDFIEHVNKIKEKDDTCGIMWVRKETVDEGLGEVNDKIGAVWNSDTKLAIRKEVLGGFIVEDGHNERGGKAAESSADAEGADTGEIIRVFTEGTKIVRGEGIMDSGGELVVLDEMA
jgi:hypothetical protein